MTGQHIAAAVLFATITAFSVAACMPARGQSGDRGDGHDQHHDWYRSLTTPQGYSCCNGEQPGKPGDCRPIQAEPRDDGWWAFYGGIWQPVPPDRILPDRPTGCRCTRTSASRTAACGAS